MRKEISTCHHLNIDLSSWKFQSIIMKISAIHNKTRPVIIKISIWLRENLELSSWNSRPITKKISTVQNTLSLRKKCPYSELFWSAFSRIWTEYREIWRISLYWVRMWENMDQNNSEYGHFSRSVSHCYHENLDRS